MKDQALKKKKKKGGQNYVSSQIQTNGVLRRLEVGNDNGEGVEAAVLRG
jgi:hypothetical protein